MDPISIFFRGTTETVKHSRNRYSRYRLPKSMIDVPLLQVQSGVDSILET